MKINSNELLPFEIHSIKNGNRTLVMSPPLILTPKLSLDMSPSILIDEPAFNIYVYAYSRKKLQKELEEQLFFLWDIYRKGDRKRMTERAIKVAQNFQEHIQEINSEVTFKAVGCGAGYGEGYGHLGGSDGDGYGEGYYYNTNLEDGEGYGYTYSYKDSSGRGDGYRFIANTTPSIRNRNGRL